MKFEEGTTVWLKSGSPEMTIKFHHEMSDEWICTWFYKNEHNEAGFKEAQLTTKNPKPRRGIQYG